jgi:hypothetical protein
MEMLRFANIANEPRAREAPVELPPNATSLDLLRAIYRSPQVQLTTRIRCAMACLQYEHPRLAVVAQITEQSFAEVLERRLQKLRAMENGKMIEAPQPQQTGTDARLPPPIADKRYRRRF